MTRGEQLRDSHRRTASGAVKVLLLVNSSASSVTPRSRVVIRKALSADHEVTVAETSRRGHAAGWPGGGGRRDRRRRRARRRRHAQRGGQRAWPARPRRWRRCPAGSTNVFARTIGLPNDPIEATGVLLDALARRSIRRVGLGSVNGRYFLFHTGVGFDAAVVEQVERRAALKRYAGHPLFVYAGFDTWIRHYDRSAPRFAVHHADGRWIDDGYLTIVLNTNPYTYLGDRPLDLAPEATLDRGLAVVTLRTLALARMVQVMVGVLGAVGAAQHPLARPPHRHRPGSRSGPTARSPTRSTATTSATPRGSSSASPGCSTSFRRDPPRPGRRPGRGPRRRPGPGATRAVSTSLVAPPSTPASADSG